LREQSLTFLRPRCKFDSRNHRNPRGEYHSGDDEVDDSRRMAMQCNVCESHTEGEESRRIKVRSSSSHSITVDMCGHCSGRNWLCRAGGVEGGRKHEIPRPHCLPVWFPFSPREASSTLTATLSALGLMAVDRNLPAVVDWARPCTWALISPVSPAPRPVSGLRPPPDRAGPATRDNVETAKRLIEHNKIHHKPREKTDIVILQHYVELLR
jgi:hypothetical protein